MQQDPRHIKRMEKVLEAKSAYLDHKHEQEASKKRVHGS